MTGATQYRSHPATRRGAFLQPLHLTDVSTHRYGAAYRVHRLVADQEIEIGVALAERCEAGGSDLRAGLPPSVLSADHLGIEIVIEPCPGASAGRSVSGWPPSPPRLSHARLPLTDADRPGDRVRGGADWAGHDAGSRSRACPSRRSGSADTQHARSGLARGPINGSSYSGSAVYPCSSRVSE